MTHFGANTADQIWRQACDALRARAASAATQPSRAGETSELLHVVLELFNPRQRWITSRLPPINPAFGIAEVLWILAGSDDSAFLNYWFPRLPEFAGAGAQYEGAYGYRLRHRFGIDQIRSACKALTANPSSRQVVLQFWDPSTDLPLDDGQPRSEDVPCNVSSLLKIRNGRLQWTQIMRSNDLYRGLPYNIIQFTYLQEIMASWIGVEVGSYTHWSDSLHAYSPDFSAFTCATEPETGSLDEDSFRATLDEGNALFYTMFGRAEELQEPSLTPTRLARLISVPEAPSGYGNLLRILAAESARRRNWHAFALELTSECTNRQLRDAWLRWFNTRPHAPRGSNFTEGRINGWT